MVDQNLINLLTVGLFVTGGAGLACVVWAVVAKAKCKPGEVPPLTPAVLGLVFCVLFLILLNQHEKATFVRDLLKILREMNPPTAKP